MINNKKGISGIITMLIIIALVLVAVGVVWYVVQNILEQGQAETEQAASDLFDECPAADITDETDSGGICLATEEVRIVGGEYCCVAL